MNNFELGMICFHGFTSNTQSMAFMKCFYRQPELVPASFVVAQEHAKDVGGLEMFIDREASEQKNPGSKLVSMHSL